MPPFEGRRGRREFSALTSRYQAMLDAFGSTPPEDIEFTPGQLMPDVSQDMFEAFMAELGGQGMDASLLLFINEARKKHVIGQTNDTVEAEVGAVEFEQIEAFRIARDCYDLVSKLFGGEEGGERICSSLLQPTNRGQVNSPYGYEFETDFVAVELEGQSMRARLASVVLFNQGGLPNDTGRTLHGAAEIRRHLRGVVGDSKMANWLRLSVDDIRGYVSERAHKLGQVHADSSPAVRKILRATKMVQSALGSTSDVSADHLVLDVELPYSPSKKRPELIRFRIGDYTIRRESFTVGKKVSPKELVLARDIIAQLHERTIQDYE